MSSDEIIEKIREFFSDTTRSRAETLDELNKICSEVEMMIAVMEDEEDLQE
jgi:hypothetical protein